MILKHNSVVCSHDKDMAEDPLFISTQSKNLLQEPHKMTCKALTSMHILLQFLTLNFDVLGKPSQCSASPLLNLQDRQ